MTALFSLSRSPLYLRMVLAVSFCLLTACAAQSRKGATYKELQRTLAKREASLKETEEKMANVQMQLWEKEAQIKELEKRLAFQQINLDEAIQEVVRAKAKLRSLETKAEAASQIAEAEIAIKALKAKLKGQETGEDIIKAEQLLKMSTREFKRENYGGALYLTAQAQGHIKAGQMQIGGQEKVVPVKRLPPVEGEVLFALPLPLRVIKKSNLRQGPDLNSKVITRLKKGTPLTGYSYKGQWVRVTGDEGSDGWIYFTLLSNR